MKKKKRIVKKTTLDKKHKLILDDFKNKHNNLDNSCQTICELEIELDNLNKIDYNDYTHDIIKKKAYILEEIRKNKKELSRTNLNIDETLYFNEAIDYILPYYEKGKKQNKSKHLMEISDFFRESNIIKTDIEYENNSKLLNEYTKITEYKHDRVSKIKKFKPKYCSNKDCNNQELILHLSDGFLTCTSCGYCQEVLLDSDKPNFKEPVPDATAYAYKRINHFNEWLAQFQAKESTDIPKTIYKKIIIELKKEKLLDKHITPQKMRKILKKLNLNKYYEHAPHIIYRIYGIAPPKITREVEEKLRQMFKDMQDPFALYSPTNRKNFLSYSYTLHKFCELLELDDFLPCFPLLKSREKLKEQDDLWGKICNYLNWQYIPSI